MGSLAMSQPSENKEPKVSYPGFSLSDKAADEFTKECEPKIGEEFAGTVRLRVTSLTDDEYGNRVQFDVVELDDLANEKGEDEKPDEDGKEDEEESDETETKALGYKRKKTVKEAPDMSAKSLED